MDSKNKKNNSKSEVAIKSLAILTSGGDSPGMNNAVRAVAKKAECMGISSYIVKEGYKGLIDDLIFPTNFKLVDQWLNVSGTRILSARFPKMVEDKYQEIAAKNLKKHNIDALVVIGGDGSFRGAQALAKKGVKVIALPGTIDNDIPISSVTIGFDSALNSIIVSLDAIRSTMQSHNRVAIVEVMGRNCPDLAVWAAYGSGAEITITQDNPMTQTEIVERCKEARNNGHRSILILVSENVLGKNGIPDIHDLKTIINYNGFDCKEYVIGHLQRGWMPSALERFNAARIGIYAVELLAEGKSEIAVGLQGEHLVYKSIDEALEMRREIRSKMLEEVNEINIK